MKTIALIHPKIDFKENYPCSWIPFSVLSIGSALPQERFNVRIFDENCLEKKQIYEALTNDDILLIGLSIMTGGGQIGNALEISTKLKEMHPEAAVVFGGPHANVLPVQTCESDAADYVLCGAGQTSFVMLVTALDERKDLDNIPGLYYKVKGRVVKPVGTNACISSLTPYDFDLIDAAQYVKYDSTISQRTLNYITSQGCPYACRFCYESVYGKKYYTLQTAFVEKDLRLYREKYNVDGIKFYDADFFVNRKKCSAIIDSLNELSMKWAASIHPNDLKKHPDEMLSIIAESGCTRLLMGMESGNDRILHEVINKRTNAADYIRIAQKIAKYGILGSYTFMVGFPGEMPEEMEDTFNLVKTLQELAIPIETKIHIYLPYPGTPLFEHSIRLGHSAPEKFEDWSGYNYYKAMTPWTNEVLEQRAAEYTMMIDKNKKQDGEDRIEHV